MEYIHPLTQFLARAKQHPGQVYLHQPVNGEWTSYTWQQVDIMARTIAAALTNQGYAKGDRIAILGKNSMEWLVADFAIAMAGMVSVPIYATAGEETIRYVLEHSEAKMIFVGKLAEYESLQRANPGIASVGFPYEGVEADIAWQQWLTDYQPLETIATPALDDTFTIVYTSGSTGKPKGVVSTGRNLAAAAMAAAPGLVEEHSRWLSYLPMAHITERSLVTMLSQYKSIEVFFNESLDTFASDLSYTQPTAFISVPRLWAKFQSQIFKAIPEQRLSKLLAIPFVRGLVAKKIRKTLGFAQCTYYGSGTAPIPLSLLKWYESIGINIAEGWGMTEVSGAASGNTPYVSERLGSIGVPMGNMEFKTDTSGELLVKGDAVIREYYKNPEATAEAFVDGWFKTGDMVAQNADGSWNITGRVKEQFKTAKGKYVAPVPIESLLEANPLVEQSCVMGSGMPAPVAAIVIGERQGMENTEIEQSLLETLKDVNQSLESHERIGQLLVVAEPWGIDNGLLTPTLKLKRAGIEKAYTDIFEAGHSQQVIWQ